MSLTQPCQRAPELAIELRSAACEIQRSEAVLAGSFCQLQTPLRCGPAYRYTVNKAPPVQGLHRHVHHGCAHVSRRAGKHVYTTCQPEGSPHLSMVSVRSGELST